MSSLHDCQNVKKLKIDNCENCSQKKQKNPPKYVMRLTSMHGHFQNPMRLGGRVPARIAVCATCRNELTTSELIWQEEGEYTDGIVAEGYP